MRVRCRRCQSSCLGMVLCGNSYLRVVQKVLNCDVTLLSTNTSDWSQKGKFNSCSIITLELLLM